MSKLKFGKYSVDISNLSKEMLPKHITKEDIINYYINISGYMLPFLKDRPIMMQRFPDGIQGDSFYQKNRGSYFPEWIKSVSLKIVNTVTDYVLCQNKATLIYLANQACLVFHSWLSKYPKIEYPDKLIFDLDPSTKDFEIVRATAFYIKEILEDHKLHPFVMTTGSKGLHVIVHLNSKYKFEETKKFARSVAEYLSKKFPNDLTTELNKEKRGTRLFIDYLRNELGATSVVPYSLRALDNGPVATPISWEELKDTNLVSQSYNISNIFDRLKNLNKDPWGDFKSIKNDLPKFKY